MSTLNKNRTKKMIGKKTKKKTKRVIQLTILTIVLFLTAFLTACSLNTDEKSNSNEDLTTGINGLVLTPYFERNNFIISGNQRLDLPYYLILENNGREKISRNDYSIKVTGYDKSIIKMNNIITGNELEPKSILNPKGGTEILFSKDFPIQVNGNDLKNEKYDFELIFNLCYKYKTFFSENLFLIPSSTIDSSLKQLNSQILSFSEGQGAPLTITRVEPIVLENEVKLIIDVKQGSGDLIYYPLGSFDRNNCGEINYNERFKFKITDARISNSIGDCINKEIQIREDGTGTFSCSFRTKIENPTTYIVSFELEYFVYDYTKQSITITKI